MEDNDNRSAPQFRDSEIGSSPNVITTDDIGTFDDVIRAWFQSEVEVEIPATENCISVHMQLLDDLYVPVISIAGRVKSQREGQQLPGRDNFSLSPNEASRACPGSGDDRCHNLGLNCLQTWK